MRSLCQDLREDAGSLRQAGRGDSGEGGGSAFSHEELLLTELLLPLS